MDLMSITKRALAHLALMPVFKRGTFARTNERSAYHPTFSMRVKAAKVFPQNIWANTYSECKLVANLNV